MSNTSQFVSLETVLVTVLHDYLSDYARLGCPPDSSAEALEYAWRKAISRLHPDRAQPGGVEPTQDMREITAAYRRLRAFEQRHGRLPGSAPLPGTEARRATPTSRMQSTPIPAPRASSRMRWTLGLVAFAALVLAVSLLVPKTRESDIGVLDSTLETPHVSEPPLQREPFEAPGQILLGDTAQRVVELAGMPIIVNKDVWEYGPSHLRLRANRVVDWYSSPLRPLPVASERPPEREPSTDW